MRGGHGSHSGGDRSLPMWSINGRPYRPGRDLFRAELGTVERWRFTTDVHHPVHAHLARRIGGGLSLTTTAAVGTFTLPDVQLDRFTMRLELRYLSEQEEASMLRRRIERGSAAAVGSPASYRCVIQDRRGSAQPRRHRPRTAAQRPGPSCRPAR